LPVFENGLTPILKGAVILSGYISIQNTTMLMVYPVYIKDKAQGKKAFIKGFLWANTVVLITVLLSILVLGSLVVTKSSFPTLLLAEEINIGMVLTRTEYAISFMWTLSEFIIAALYFFAAITALSELLGLKDHLKITAPMGLLCLMLSLTVNPGAIEKESWIPIGFLPNVITFGVVVPLIMLAVYVVRTAGNRRSGI
jgi:spore germination protein KB